MVIAYFQNDVNVFTVLEDMVEKEDIFMLKGFMDFNLGD